MPPAKRPSGCAATPEPERGVHVELVSPEGVLFEGDASMVVARTVGAGDIAFMTGHVPFVGSLAVHPIKLILEDGSTKLIAAHRGFIEVQGTTVTILSDVAEVADTIDADRAEAAKARAEEALRVNADDDEAKAALKRAEVRLSVAKGTAGAISH